MSDSAAFIRIDNLNKSYGLFSKFQALTDINLTIEKGETFGLIGPNGAGKTTLMGCMLGLLQPSTGSILIDDRQTNDIEIKAITGFMPERPNFDAWMIVENYLHYHHTLAGLSEKMASDNVYRALKEVGLEAEVGKRLIKKLSRGMLQRLGLAQLVIGQPELCFLDEPTSGMDPLGMSLVRDLFSTWKRQRKTIIMNSHHLDQVEKVCDRVAFIENGKILSIENLTPSAQAKQTFLIQWAKPYPSREHIVRIAQQLNVEIFSLGEGNARFLVMSKIEGSNLVKMFIQSNAQVEQALYEHKDLVELFKKDHAKNE